MTHFMFLAEQTL